MKNYGSVHARFRSNGKAKYCSLGLNIKEAEWEKFKSKKWLPSNVISSIGIKYGDFSSMLAQIKNIPDEEFYPKKIQKLVEKLICASREIDDKEKHLIINKGELLLSEYMLKYHEDLKSGKRLKKQQSVTVSKGYMDTIKAVRKSILKFEGACEKHFLLCDVDSVFRRSYIKWLSDQGIKPNTIQTHLSTILTLMKNALEDGLTKNDSFLKKGFVPAGEHVDSVYLSNERLKQLIALDLSENGGMGQRIEGVLNTNVKNGGKRHRVRKNDIKVFEMTRDIFVVGCLTGQRISDYKRINSEMITEYEGKKFIMLVQRKEKKKVMIPLDKRVKAILDKYNGTLPKVSEQTFNKHIKTIAEVMGWTEVPLFEMEKSDGDKNRRFCDMVFSHTARRTFATIAYGMGIPLASIMAVTGHCSEDRLRTYLHLQAEDKAIIAARDLNGFLRLRRRDSSSQDAAAGINESMPASEPLKA